MDLYALMRKFPGGIFIIPWFIAVFINTFCPQIMQIGGLTTALFSSDGALCMASFMTFIIGTQFDLSRVREMLKRGMVLTVTKLLIGFISAILFVKLFGLDGILGISAVAFTTVIISCNPSVYLALVVDYGDRDDIPLFALLNTICMPVFPLMILGISQGGGFAFIDIVNTLAPFLIGMVIGNIDHRSRDLMSHGILIATPLLGFCLGASVNLFSAFRAGFSGLLLAAVFLVINITIMLLVDRLILHRPGYAAIASCSVAGISLIGPATIAASNSIYLPYVDNAEVLAAMVLIITVIVTPLLCKLSVRLFGDGRIPDQQISAEIIRGAVD